MINLKNKVAIVTGASSGIGKEIVYLLAQNGINVTLVARQIEKLKKIEYDLNNLGYHSLIVQANLEIEKEIKNLFTISNNYWGKTDILINCAGVIIDASFSKGNSDDWKKMWNVNVHATCIAIQEALNLFNKIDGGHIINISSMSAHRVATGGSFYTATKFAIKAISESLRKELMQIGSMTRVSCISPGLVATGFGKVDTNNNIDKKYLDPIDIANAVLHVLNTPKHVAIQDILIRSSKQFD